MITIYHHIGTSNNAIPRDCKLKKAVLNERVKILTDIVQALIDRLATLEKVKLSVLCENLPCGSKYILYEEPLEEKPTP